MTLKHPEYARGISSAELIKEAIEFCDTELDSFDGMDFDSDSEVCCQRSNTFIRELARRLETATPAPQPKPLPSQPAERDDRRAEVEAVDYDAGYLNDFGGGNVEWWWDYLRAEIERANEHWRGQIDTLTADRDRLKARVEERDAQIEAAREFVKRHPKLTIIDLAEFEAFLKVPAAFDAARQALKGEHA